MTLEHALEASNLEHKNFKTVSCSSTCRDIYFTENILGATAKVTLHFTLNNKMLYKVEILWNSGAKEEDMQRFTDDLTAFLDQEYGQSQINIHPNPDGYNVLKEKKWQPESNTEIVVRKGVSSLTLIFTDIELKGNHDFEISQFLK